MTVYDDISKRIAAFFGVKIIDIKEDFSERYHTLYTNKGDFKLEPFRAFETRLLPFERIITAYIFPDLRVRFHYNDDRLSKLKFFL